MTRFIHALSAAVLLAHPVFAIPAFPGAEGAGANASGGRPNAFGGHVYHVTTLDPDPGGVIVGSLRYGLRSENWAISLFPPFPPDFNNPSSFEVIPRLIVFDVGGTIDLGEYDATPMNFTLAGQTAPGGITIYGGEFNPAHRAAWDSGTPPKTNNIVLRNVAIRTNDANEKDALWFAVSNSIADHVSGAWYTDEGVSLTDRVKNVTVQHSIIGPGWNNPDGDGSQVEGETPGADISIHHNLYIHNDARNPRVGEKVGPGVELDFRNNVIYNWNDSSAGYSVAVEPSFSNFVNNYYIGGANNDNNDVIFESGGTLTRIYQSGNLLDRNFNSSADGTDLGWAAFAGSEAQQAVPYTVPHGVTQTPEEALATVQNYVGARWWDRDFLDQRSLAQLQTYGNSAVPIADRGQVLSSIEAADIAAVEALLPDPNTGEAPFQRLANWDTDNDGMPNFWEAAHGFNPDSPVGTPDWNLDADVDGYVNLEEYINQIAEWPAPYPITYDSPNSRFHDINNWDITRPSPNEADTTTNWQPSRFDTAIVHSGTLQVEKVGQHAGTIEVGPDAGDNATLRIRDGWLRVEDTIELGMNGGTGALVVQLTGQLHVGRITRGTGSFALNGGLLNADIVEFGFINAGGIIAPGKSIFDVPNGIIDFGGVDSMHVMGDLRFTGGKIQFDIAGDQPGEYDFVDVDGKLTGGGTLEVILNGFSPGPGDTFNLFDFSTSAGAFTYMLPALGGSLSWDTSQILISGELSVIGVDADFDDDNDVDGMDLLTWQSGFGLTGQPDKSTGDATGDGIVDHDDLMAWQSQYGLPVLLSAASTAVPEPASVVLLLGAGLCFPGGWRRRVGSLRRVA